MEKKDYYLRLKIDQGRYAYLEIGQSWKETMLLKFRITDPFPLVLSGANYENRCEIQKIIFNALLYSNKLLREEILDWDVIEPDSRLELMVKDYLEAIQNLKLNKTWNQEKE